jgi:hypothetical protein
MNWSQQKVRGPILVRFHSFGKKVYIDVSKILIIRELEPGSRIIMQGDVPLDLDESSDAVMKRLREVNEELTSW